MERSLNENKVNLLRHAKGYIRSRQGGIPMTRASFRMLPFARLGVRSFSAVNLLRTNFRATVGRELKTSKQATGGNAQQHSDPLRDQILRESLKFVNSHGWTLRSIQEGCRALNVQPTVHGILANGEVDLIDYFVSSCNDRLAVELQALSSEQYVLRVLYLLVY